MLLDERDRAEIYQLLTQQFGAERAGRLMAVIPTVAWDDIVTKDYLDARLERQDRTLDHQMALLRADMETLEQRVIAEFRHEWRTSLLAIVSTAMVVAGAFVAAGRLA